MTQEELDKVKSILKTLHENGAKLLNWLEVNGGINEVSVCLQTSNSYLHRAIVECPDTFPEPVEELRAALELAMEAARVHPAVIPTSRIRQTQEQLQRIAERERELRYDWTASVWDDPPRPRSGFVFPTPILPDDEDED